MMHGFHLLSGLITGRRKIGEFIIIFLVPGYVLKLSCWLACYCNLRNPMSGLYISPMTDETSARHVGI